MKLAIRTLAALLALSSTAVAENWSGVLLSDTGELRPSAGNSGNFSYITSVPDPADFSVIVGCGVSLSANTGAGVSCPSLAEAATLLNVGTNLAGAALPISISKFARSDRLDSVSGRVTALEASASTFATTANLNGVASRVTTLETNASTFATAANLNGVASRVTAIEGSLGSFASVGSLNGVAARVATIEANMSSFATTSNLNALATRVADAEGQLAAIQSSVSDLAAFVPEALGDMRRRADEGSAMAAAMTTVAPADGKANRIGFNTATYKGSTAVAVSYSRAAGDVDFNVGVAMAGENAMVKAGAGFSW